MKFGRYRYASNRLLAIHPNLSAAEIAERFGVDRKTIQRWRNPTSTFNQWDADRYAIKVGKHPGEIWPNWFDINC